MATVSVQWRASAALQRSELIATGTTPRAERWLQIDLATISPEQRTAVLAHVKPTGIYTGDEPNFTPIDITRKYVLEADRSPDGSLAHYKQQALAFDAEPTLDQVLATAQEVAEAEAGYIAREHAIEQIRRERDEAQRTLYDRIEGEINALKGDLAGLRAYQIPTEAYQVLPRVHVMSADALSQKRNRYISELEEEQREAERQQWIAAHGSAHLQRCIEAGYNCKRLYVVERAALEAPGFTVDFDDKAAWKDRSCPTPAALDAEDAARALGLGEPLIVWLTEPPSARVPDPEGYDFEEFDPCEAVVLRNYLGRYDLVQIVAGD